MKSPLILAGDIGATKTRLGIFDPSRKDLKPLAEEVLSSRAYPGLPELIEDFLSARRFAIERAVLGIAGPVVGDEAVVTNLGWETRGKDLARAFHLREVKLINDLVAYAWSLRCLSGKDYVSLKPGRADASGNIALIAPGTGLGESFVIREGRRFHPCPSEGGHADFAPRSPEEGELLGYLKRSFDHVSYDRICSGSGLGRIYGFLKERGAIRGREEISREIGAAKDAAPVIIEAATRAACPLCLETVRIFIRVLAAEAGNLALKVFALGGVYLAGGIPPRIVPLLQSGEFAASFTDKGRLSYLLGQIPVRVITNPQAALLGAASCGRAGVLQGGLRDPILPPPAAGG